MQDRATELVHLPMMSAESVRHDWLVDELELLDVTNVLPNCPTYLASWWSSWGVSLLVHGAVLAGCWLGLPAEQIRRIAISGSPIVLSVEFSESVPTPLMEMAEVELELTAEDLSDPAEPVSDATPLPEVAIEIPVEQACPQPEKQPAEQAEASSTPAEAAVHSTPTDVGLDPLIPAEAFENDRPDYPREALIRGWYGRVLVRLTICKEGRVSQVQLVESSGHQVLDQAAIDTVRNWRFQPARRGTEPVESTEVLPVNFLPRS